MNQHQQQMIWNQNIDNHNNQNNYQSFVHNQLILQNNCQSQQKMQSYSVNNNNADILQKSVKQQNQPPQNIFALVDPQQNLKFSSSENQSEDQNSTEQKNKKINKKQQKIHSHAAYKKYSRITPQIKQQLINLIARQNMSIKDASIKLKINYSSAKFIFSRYRDRKLQIIDNQVHKVDAIKDIVVFNKIQNFGQTETMDCMNKIVIKCSSGGKFEAQTNKVFNLKQIYDLYLDSNGSLNKIQHDSD